MPENKTILGSGSAEDDVVAMTTLLSMLMEELGRLNRKVARDAESNREWWFVMKMVLEGHMGPQQAATILKNKALTGGTVRSGLGT